MDQRSFERVPENIPIDLYHNDQMYEGTVTNLSGTGLHIHAEKCPPIEANIKVVLILGDEVFDLPAQVKRIMYSNDLCCNIGVQLRDTSRRYCEFVSIIHDYYNLN